MKIIKNVRYKSVVLKSFNKSIFDNLPFYFFFIYIKMFKKQKIATKTISLLEMRDLS